MVTSTTELLTLVDELRRRGATEISVGDIHVVFSDVYTAVTSTPEFRFEDTTPDEVTEDDMHWSSG